VYTNDEREARSRPREGHLEILCAASAPPRICPRTFAVHEACRGLVDAAVLVALDVQRVPERLRLQSQRAQSWRRTPQKKTPTSVAGCLSRTLPNCNVSAVDPTPPHDAIPVWSAVVRRRAQARDGVALAADVVGGDVLDVVDRDLGREVGVDLDERRGSAMSRACTRTLPTSCASMAARSDWNHSKLSLRGQTNRAR